MPNPDTPIHELTVAQLGAAYRGGALSPVAVTEYLLGRIGRLDESLQAFVRVTRERALGEARAAEAALKAGQDRGPLLGIPYAVKDLYDVRGEVTQAGTRLLADNVAGADCAAVTRLSAAGMVLLGKVHTVPLALGGAGINHELGTPRNPWAEAPHTPGGSSSGSGVAVAAGLVPVALGTDTGGSVRLPAALSGCVGLKTTVGRISRQGVFPLSWSLDSVGPLTHTVEDAALVYAVLQGEDPRDETTLGIALHDPLEGLEAGVRGLRLGIAETVCFDEVDGEVADAVRKAARVLAGLGARVESVEVPPHAALQAEPRRRLLPLAEGLAHHGALLREHRDALDWAVAERLETGVDFRATDYIRVNNLFAQQRAALQDTWNAVDALLTPTSPIPAQPVAAVDADSATFARLAGLFARNTSLGNALGLCAVSLPCGFSENGLPIGLMVSAPAFREELALRIARAFEQATDWHTRRPAFKPDGA